jgi:hypothetical protein
MINDAGKHGVKGEEIVATESRNMARQPQLGFRWPEVSIYSSASFPKFVIHGGNLLHELRKQRGTSKHMILVPLFDLKFLSEFAATGVGTSNRRY